MPGQVKKIGRETASQATPIVHDPLTYYAQNQDHLADELTKLDLLLQVRVLEFRQAIRERMELASPQVAYISHEQVDWLLQKKHASIRNDVETRTLREQFQQYRDTINDKVSQSLEQGTFLALIQLGHFFGLTPFELDTIMVCLAPELDRKYDQLYAYLQDDITRKKPSVDLVLELLCETPEEKRKARTAFGGHAPLLHHGLLHLTDDLQSPSGSSDLSRFIKLDPRIVNYVLGNTHIDERLVGFTKFYRPHPMLEEVPVAPEIKTQLLHFTTQHLSKSPPERHKLVFYLHGPYGTGKQELAQGLCGSLNCSMLSLDMELLLMQETEVESLLRTAFRESLLLQASVYLDNFDALLQDDKATGTLKKVAKVINEYGWYVFLDGVKPWAPKGLFNPAIFHAVSLPIPDVPIRTLAWNKVLKQRLNIEPTWADYLAQHFLLTPGQIQDAAEWATNKQAMDENPHPLTIQDLTLACRHQSYDKLKDLSVKITSLDSWNSLILPEDKIAQLKEICSQVAHQHQVFTEWGFSQKLSYGKGLSVLFSGPPGTGKTMAAGIIAGELQLDLHKIDLSGVVSKYIGETEKNLSKIFQEAEASNAILFFDEADALFGKRTEVSDAHDRYANIETSYLLQKVEMYDGIVILATNLRENMDQAFTRRMRFIVDFPFPDVVSRKEIWKTHFPSQAPASKDIDFDMLAQHLQIAGGNIKNIVLNAAFSAAANGKVIGMEHIFLGAKREFEKMGKRWDEKSLVSYKG